MTRLLVVHSDRRRLALELSHVHEIVWLGSPYPVPSPIAACRGVADISGRLTPVFHLGALLEGRSAPDERSEVGVLVRMNGRWAALEVDHADTLVEGSVVDVVSADRLGARAVARHQGALIPVLDLAAIARRVADPGRAA